MLFLISSHCFPLPSPPLFLFYRDWGEGGRGLGLFISPLTVYLIDEWRDRSSACKIIPTACWLNDEYEEVKYDYWFHGWFTTCNWLFSFTLMYNWSNDYWDTTICADEVFMSLISGSNADEKLVAALRTELPFAMIRCFSLFSFRFMYITISALKFFAFCSSFLFPFIFSEWPFCSSASWIACVSARNIRAVKQRSLVQLYLSDKVANTIIHYQMGKKT